MIIYYTQIITLCNSLTSRHKIIPDSWRAIKNQSTHVFAYLEQVFVKKQKPVYSILLPGYNF